MSIVLRKRGLVDGQVVYKDYKVFDDDNAANNVADNTPGDYSDNAPVPLAKFYLRELDFPNRSFGSSQSPLTADINGRFVINTSSSVRCAPPAGIPAIRNCAATGQVASTRKVRKRRPRPTSPSPAVWAAWARPESRSSIPISRTPKCKTRK